MMKLRNIFAALTAIAYSSSAFAQDHAAAATGGGSGHLGLAAAIAVGLAALGGTLGQGKAVAAAMDGIARNPSAQGKMFIPMMIGLALMESLVLLAFVISLQLLGKF